MQSFGRCKCRCRCLSRNSPFFARRLRVAMDMQEALCGLLYRKAGMHEGKMRKDILYADFVLRESARQVSFVHLVDYQVHTRRLYVMIICVLISRSAVVGIVFLSS